MNYLELSDRISELETKFAELVSDFSVPRQELKELWDEIQLLRMQLGTYQRPFPAGRN